jgi:hypothetical protein
MVQYRIFSTFRSQETCQTAVVQDPSQINGDNVNSVRYEAVRHLKTKKIGAYLKELMRLQHTLIIRSFETYTEEEIN